MTYINRIIQCLIILVLSTLFVHSHVAAESNQSVFESLIPNESEDREPIDPLEEEANNNASPTDDSNQRDDSEGSGTKVNDILENEKVLNEQENNLNNPVATEESSPFKLIFNLIFYTLIMVALILILFKFLAYKQRKMGEHQLIQTMGGTSLGNNKSLQLVKVGGKIYLLGVADHISLIKEIDDQELIEQMEFDQNNTVDYLSKGIEGLKTRFMKGPDHIAESNFQAMFEESIQKQKAKVKEVEISMENSSYSPSERRNQTWNP